jgi:hypothetical protein
MKISEVDSVQEREEFMKGVVPGFNKRPQSRQSQLVLGLVAGYLLGKASSQSSDKKGK